jgi:hypothetical protein
VIPNLDVFLLLDLEGGSPSLSMLLFILEVVTGTRTEMGKELGSKLEGFDLFGVGSSRLSI